ncbi:hypothetical protein ARMGADRAFT_1092819 [Armillaria gallica]|uniref:Uncharacterized protein n=1 Tax=Armillaria gallica TaxID=47427 RepID=A0A2H3CMX1_ARMGA|nr:hypothetical protein ARMGADRAFT_1092819 [Armillaria gallica]
MSFISKSLILTTFLAPKNWHVVTVDQDVRVFSSWLDTKAWIQCVPDPAYTTRPTYAQAMAEYHKQYEAEQVEIILLLGLKW